MKYKLIALDMDGTLLNSDKNIGDYTLSSIQKAVNAGVFVTIATGRSIQGVEKYNDILKLRYPVITYNGAVIVLPQDRKVLYETTLEESVATDIIHYSKTLSPTIEKCIWSNNQLYVYELNDGVYLYASLSGVEPILISDKDEISLMKQGISKILWYDDSCKIKGYQNQLRGILKGNVNYCTSEPYFLEFFNGYASKGNALKFLGEYYNIDSSEMIAIGDGMNDLSMIQYAGLGVAMGSAPDGLKALADYVTASSDADGVAHVIDRFIR